MKTKISVIIISVVLLFGGATSCSDWLDLRPANEIVLDDFWQTEDDVNGVLAACYQAFTEESAVYRMIVWGEVRSDNIVEKSIHNDRKDLSRLLLGDLTYDNTYCSWASFYTIINYCNIFLHYAPGVMDLDSNFTQDDLNLASAEVKALRALAYFYLVRAFKEVPLVLDPSIDDTQDYNVPKSKEEDIIAQILTDLTEARVYARESFGREDYDKGRITRASIDAILADVYLWKEDYQNCVSACNRVLANEELELEEKQYVITSVFYLGNSAESIFELPFSSSRENKAVRVLYGGTGTDKNEDTGEDEVSSGDGEIGFPLVLQMGESSPFNYQVAPGIIESEGKDGTLSYDIRQRDSYSKGEPGSIFKYPGQIRMESATGVNIYSYRSNTANWILYRLSDVKLMKAEALVQIGNSTEDAEWKTAMKEINEVYLRSNPAKTDSLSLANYAEKLDFEKLVLRERQRELLFEGKRWFDLVRMSRRHNSTSYLNEYVNKKQDGGGVSLGAPVMDAMYMPISRRELEANTELVQNPYYATK